MKPVPFFRQGRLPIIQVSREEAARRIKSWRSQGAKVRNSGGVITVSDWGDNYLNNVYLGVEVIILRQS